MAGNNDDDDAFDSGVDVNDRSQTKLEDVSDKLDKDLDAFLETTKDDRQQNQDRSQDRAQGQDRQDNQDQRSQGTKQAKGQDQVDQTGQDRSNLDRPPSRDSFAQPPRSYGALFRTDQTGNVIDAEGRMIAAVGKERRVFERMFRHIGPIQDQFVQMKQRLDIYESADSGAKQAGLTLEDRALGLRLAQAWKSDKAGTLRFLLNQAQESGIDVSSISQGGGGLTAAEARQLISDVLDDRLKRFDPFVENLNRERETSEQRQQAMDAIADFYEDWPQARVHSGHIATIMERRGLTMDQAWAELRVAAAAHGWDLSKDLQPQAMATQSRRNPTGRGGNQRLPDFNGRGNVDGSTERRPRRIANVDDSYDDIIAGALEDAAGQTH